MFAVTLASERTALGQSAPFATGYVCREQLAASSTTSCSRRSGSSVQSLHPAEIARLGWSLVEGERFGLPIVEEIGQRRGEVALSR